MTKAEAYDRHVNDSLALLPIIERHLPSEKRSAGAALTAIDVGTGAGLPGMIFAIARPSWRVTLLDTLRKRCDFLSAAVDKVGLKNVSVVWSRAEAAGQTPANRDAFDIATARAVAETRTLAELCLPFVKPGGLWVAPKGVDPKAEVAAAGTAIKLLGGKVVDLAAVGSFDAEGKQRTALVVAKLSPTPRQYPRSAPLPNKSPL